LQVTNVDCLYSHAAVLAEGFATLRADRLYDLFLVKLKIAVGASPALVPFQPTIVGDMLKQIDRRCFGRREVVGGELVEPFVGKLL